MGSGLSQLAGGASALIQGLVTGVATAVFDLVLILFMLFFLLRDGEALQSDLRHISPLSDAQEDIIFDHLSRTVKGILQAMVVVPLAQGFLASVGFWIFGVPSPVSWGVAVTLAAMVPVLGSPLGWVPACVLLFLHGATWQWVGMLLFGIVVISGIDNVLKPLLLKGSADIHPLLGFLSIMGGVFAFGVFGFLIGPVILSLLISAIRIYRLDIAAPGGGGRGAVRVPRVRGLSEAGTRWLPRTSAGGWPPCRADCLLSPGCGKFRRCCPPVGLSKDACREQGWGASRLGIGPP